MREVEAFLSSNPSEIVTLILEDYVRSERGLPKLFRDAGLARYWFPVSRMPRRGATASWCSPRPRWKSRRRRASRTSVGVNGGEPVQGKDSLRSPGDGRACL